MLRSFRPRPSLLSLRLFSSAPRVCVIGSGPGGFYASKYLLKAHKDVKIDMLEQLPAPFGLVRYGVAPDHPEVKNVADDFKKVAFDNRDRFQLFGGVQVGRAISLSELRSMYDSVVLAVGAQGDKPLGVEGEGEDPSIVSARDFVLWYNGHPTLAERWGAEPPSVCSSPLPKRAVVIGMGNVALDVARIMMMPIHTLNQTDISSKAAAWLDGKLDHVDIVGRRGYVDAAFTNKEFRELTRIPGVLPIIDPNDLYGPQEKAPLKRLSAELSKGTDRAKKRGLELVKEMVENFLNIDEFKMAGVTRSVQIRFNWVPKNFTKTDGGVAIEIERPPSVGGGATMTLGPNLLSVKSVGFKVLTDSVGNDTALPLSPGAGVKHDGLGKVEEGLFASGWTKRGPKGVIAANIVCAQQTAGAIAEELRQKEEAGTLKGNPQDIVAVLLTRGVRVVPLESWVAKGEPEELRRGEEVGKLPGIAEKMTSVEEMYRVLKE